MFKTASVVGGKTRAGNIKTVTGCKDTFQEHFLERMAESYKNVSGRVGQQAALDRCIEGLPSNILSPVWRLHGMNFKFAIIYALRIC